MLIRVIKNAVRGLLAKREEPTRLSLHPLEVFHTDHYLRHNARRLEHLASLKLRVAGMSVLEVGAGIGDHSHYYLDRGCSITITEARRESLSVLTQRYPGRDIRFLDMEWPTPVDGGPFDIVHCYGLLYHLSKPAEALEFLSQHTRKMLLLETCVSFGEDYEIHLTEEIDFDPSQAYSGMGCRPTRAWLFRELQRHFEYVYVPTTQPCHEEFPLDWTMPEQHANAIQRAIFIGSRSPLDNAALAPSLLPQQARCE